MKIYHLISLILFVIMYLIVYIVIYIYGKDTIVPIEWAIVLHLITFNFVIGVIPYLKISN
jgi:hypothetical protein